MNPLSGNKVRNAIAGVAFATATTVTAAPSGKSLPLEAATMIIEYNSSAEDIGVQYFLDSEGWQQIKIFDPSGVTIFDAQTGGRLTQQGGGTELFLESVEPPIAE